MLVRKINDARLRWSSGEKWEKVRKIGILRWRFCLRDVNMMLREKEKLFLFPFGIAQFVQFAYQLIICFGVKVRIYVPGGLDGFVPETF